MKVVEKFTSINGEGTRAGELAVFIRFKGCNLRCSYCDTMWANEPDCPYKEETPRKNMCLTEKQGVRTLLFVLKETYFGINLQNTTLRKEI